MKTALVLTGGQAADGPYGIDKLQDFGYRLVEAPTAQSKLHRKLRDFIEHRLGQPLDKTLRSSVLARKADVIIAFLEHEALTAAWLKARGVPPWSKKPLVMFECWLAEELRHMPLEERRATAAKYSAVDLTMAWSSNQLDILVDAGFNEDRVASVPFGFAPELFPFVPMEDRAGGIVAIGSDRGRDYATLLDAVEGTSLPLTLVCKPENLHGRQLPENVKFQGTVPYPEYRALIANAEVVVVPTRELAYPTGQTVAMEAAASGCCLIVTGTTPMREYFSPAEALLVPAYASKALQEAMSTANANFDLRKRLGLAGSQAMKERFTYRDMWHTVSDLLRERRLVD